MEFNPNFTYLIYSSTGEDNIYHKDIHTNVHSCVLFRTTFTLHSEHDLHFTRGRKSEDLKKMSCLCLIQHHETPRNTMEPYGKAEASDPSILNPGTRRNKSQFHTQADLEKETAVPIAVWTYGEKSNLCPWKKSNPEPRILHPVT
jgi:hypothetical protein